METSQARFNANRTVVEVFIVILLINYGISSIVSAASPNRISFVDDEYPLVEGSVCKFQHNGTLGTCTHSPLCPVASYEYQRFHIRPTTCSFGTKYPSICCFGQTSGLPAFPTLPPSHDWHPSHAARPEPEQPERPELAHPSPSSYPSDSMVSTHYNTQPDAHIDHGYGQQKSSPELRKSSHCKLMLPIRINQYNSNKNRYRQGVRQIMAETHFPKITCNRCVTPTVTALSPGNSHTW